MLNWASFNRVFWSYFKVVLRKMSRLYGSSFFKWWFSVFFWSLEATTYTTLRCCVGTGRESIYSSIVLRELMGKSGKGNSLFYMWRNWDEGALKQFTVCQSQKLKKPILLPHIYLMQFLNVSTRFRSLSSHYSPVV